MSEKVIETARLDAASVMRVHAPEINESVEANAVRRVIRENWESKLKERGNNLDILSGHVEFMNRELGSLGYETMCMQNVVANTKHMSKGEMIAYTRMLEALAIGYKAKFGPDFGGLLVAGATLVSKDARSMRKNFDYFMSHISRNSNVFENAIEKEVRIIEKLNYNLGRKETGILRFFRKRDILVLKRQIRVKREKISKFESKRIKYRLLSDTLNERVSQSPRIR